MEPLSSKYSDLFEWRKRFNIFILINFLRDVYRRRKCSELLSFLIWELYHKFRFIRKKLYIKFINEKPLCGNINVLQYYKYNFNYNINVTKCKFNWKLIFIDKDNNIWGTTFTNSKTLYKMAKGCANIIKLNTFANNIEQIFISSDNIIFVCISGELYRCEDSRTFKKVLSLSLGTSFFRHNNSFTEIPNKVLIAGEYGGVQEIDKWRNCAYLYYSFDKGNTWIKNDFLIQEKCSKHVHLIKYCKMKECLLLTDGDNKKRLWVNYNTENLHRNSGWINMTKYHLNTGGYTSMVEVNGKLIFGSDYLGGTNFIITTSDLEYFKKCILPDPYRRSFIENMVIRKSNKVEEIWASLVPSSKSNGLLMFSTDFGRNWVKFYEYDNSYGVATLISSSIGPTNNIYITVPNKDFYPTTLEISNT